MYIELLGLSGVRIQSDRATILLSPPSKTSELRSSRMKADIVVLGNTGDEINVDPAHENLFVVDQPGEYESSGVFFYCLGNPPSGETTSLLTSITVEGVTVTHLGGLNKELNNAAIELFEGTDVLIIPVGGKDVLSAKQASELINTIEPRIVIPMHFARPGLKTNYETADAFFKEFGSKAEKQDKAKITKKDLPQDTMQTFYLSA